MSEGMHMVKILYRKCNFESKTSTSTSPKFDLYFYGLPRACRQNLVRAIQLAFQPCLCISLCFIMFQTAGVIEQKEREIKRLESDISGLRSKLRKKADEAKKERERASAEEIRRLELESSLQTEIDRLRKELDKVKGHLGQLRSAKNVGDEETRKLRERERQLMDEIVDLKSQQNSSRRRKYTH